MKVLVIPEDPRLDQYILKPIVERIFADLRKSPRVTVLSNPRLRGVAEALNPEILTGIVASYRRGVLDRCPEIKELKQKIELWLDAQP